jgi:hypothetical protein
MATRDLAEGRPERAGADELDRSPLSPEEIERGLRIVAELRAKHAAMLAERDGRPFAPPAWVLIDEARDERTRQLG